MGESARSAGRPDAGKARCCELRLKCAANLMIDELSPARRKLEVLHATAWYPPHTVGGTEVYVEGLVAELRRLHIESKVVVPKHQFASETYSHFATRVMTYRVNEIPTAGEFRQNTKHEGFQSFQELLAANAGGIYHQHSWTRGCGPHHLKCAKELGFRTVVTIHVPSNLCLTGTMLQLGRTQCDGFIDERKCGSCYLHSRGLPGTVAKALVHLPRQWSERVWQWNNRLATALSARIIANAKKAELATMSRTPIAL